MSNFLNLVELYSRAPLRSYVGLAPLRSYVGLAKRRKTQSLNILCISYPDTLYNRGNQNVTGMIQKGTAQAGIAIGARLAIMFFGTLTSNVKFVR